MTEIADSEFIREPAEDHASYITTTFGMRGCFAVLMFWDEDGFWDVWQTGIGSYKNADDAAVEGRQWAHEEGLEFRQ